MRSETEVAAELQAAREAYHVAAETESSAQLYARSQDIKALMQEQSDLLSAGAVPCPGCGSAPHGCLKTPVKGGKSPAPAVYEVGCLACPPLVEPAGEGQALVTERRAQSYSASGAVAAWNSSSYLPGQVVSLDTPDPA